MLGILSRLLPSKPSPVELRRLTGRRLVKTPDGADRVLDTGKLLLSGVDEKAHRQLEPVLLKANARMTELPVGDGSFHVEVEPGPGASLRAQVLELELLRALGLRPRRPR